MKGKKTAVIYLLTQLTEGYEAVEDKNVPSKVFRYGGKHSYIKGVHFQKFRRP